MSGYEVLRALRVSKVKTPILILSGLAAIQDKVKGLGFGADDYLSKPFHRDELMARIQAIVRRSKGHAESLITTGDLVVNLDRQVVEIQGRHINLSNKEYQMLELLALRKGTALTKEMFSTNSTEGWTSQKIRSLTSIYASCARSLPPRAGAQLHRDYLGPRLRPARAKRARAKNERVAPASYSDRSTFSARAL